MKILINQIHCIDPRDKLDKVLDVLIEKGKIKEVSDKVTVKADEVIDGSGLHMFPGFIDVHVHLRDPGQEHKETIESGVQAALNGGITAMVPMPNTIPACDTRSVVEYILNKAEKLHYNLFPTGTQSKGRQGKELSEMVELKDAGVCGLTDDGDCINNPLLMRHVMEYASMTDLPLMIHAEEKTLSNQGVMHEGPQSTKLGLRGIPSVSEYLIVIRDIELAKMTGARIHICHVSTKESVEVVRAAKKKGVQITCEVSPHHFALTDQGLENYDSSFKMYPPLREDEDRLAMLKGLKDGTIDMIATDHAPHLHVEKDVDLDHAPFGCIGLETAIGVTLTELYHKEKLKLETIAALWNGNPAKLINQKDFGAIRVGSVANLSIVNLDEEWVVDEAKFKSKSRNSTFIGKKLKGKPVKAICKGRVYTTEL